MKWQSCNIFLDQLRRDSGISQAPSDFLDKNYIIYAEIWDRVRPMDIDNIRVPMQMLMDLGRNIQNKEE